MSEAFVCDRCGATISGQPPMQLGTKGNDINEKLPGGTVGSKVIKKDNRQLGSRGSIGGIQLDPLNQSKSMITGGDLCGDCADAFREFWESAGS